MYVKPSLLVYRGRGKERKKHDTIEDWECLKGNLQRKVKVRYYIHGEGRLMYNGKEMKEYKCGEVRFYVDKGKQVRERASKEMCMD